MSYIPLNPIDIREVMADIKFKLSSTTNCSILINNNCSPKIVIVGGNISGTGAISLTNYSLPLIQGYQQNGVCQGEPNTNPIEIDIDSAQYIIDNCTDVSVEREFFYCDFLGSSIPVSAVSGNFPPGSRFYNSYPVTDSSIQYTVNNPFPATIGVTTYYAVPPGDTGCSYIFTIEINEITTTPSISNLVYCLNETAVALTATPTDPDYVVLYYPNNNPSTPGLLTLIPSTSTAGTFTYYVAEGPSTTCVGDRVPITVTVYDEIVISLESMTPTSCIDSSIGAIDISVTGGSGDYTYSWNDTANSTTQDISGLPAGTYTVTINDENSNCTATASFEVLEETNDAPVITAPNGFAVDGCTNADITVGGFTSLPYNETITTITEAEFLAEGGTFADDNIASITYQDSSADSCPILVTRTYTITDDCGLTATANQIITINTPALIISEANGAAIVNCLLDATETFTVPTITDGCGNTLMPSAAVVTESPNPISCEGTRTYTYTFTDCNNNQDTWSYVYNIEYLDFNLPVNEGALVTCVDEAQVVPTPPTVSDNCGVNIIPTGPVVSADPDCVGDKTYTWTYTDCANNSHDWVYTYSVNDNIQPELVGSVPANATIQCISDLPAAIDLTATDNCSDDIVASPVDTIDETDPCNVIVTRTWTFTDACDNTLSVSQTITVADTTAPVAPTAPANVTVQCLTDLPVATDLTATDNCAGTIVASPLDNIDETDPCNVIVTRTWTFTDTCNNSSSVSQIITVSDTIAPVAPAAPANVTVQCITDLPVATDLTATDNCAGTIVASPIDNVDETDPCNVIVTRTWTFTDTCNNSSSVSQIITVSDTIAPVAPAAPAPLSFQCIDEVFAAIELTATDNCAGNIIGVVSEIIDNSDSCNITITRTWTFTDTCNNSSSVSQVITVADTTAPSITTVASDQTVLCDGDGNAQESQAWLDTHAGSQATDNCSAVTWTHEILNVIDQCGETSRTLVRFIATDACNNSRTTTALFTILDLVPPTLHTQASNETVECDGLGNTTELNAWLANNGGATATDLCGNVTWTNNFTALSNGCGETGSATVIFTATDDCGNSATTTATFTIEDTIAPVAPTAPADIVYECITEIPAAIELTATDNCSGDIIGIVSEVMDSSDACNKTITRTWTFTDACDNSSSVSQTITVADTIAPVAPAAPADIAYQCVTEVPAAAELTATDNCSGDIIGVLSEVTDNSDACNITITRTWTFTDTCDNSSSVSQTITVADTIAPVAPAAPADIAYQCVTEVPVAAELTATDNCAGDIIGVLSEITNDADACNITITRTWTFTDLCENTSSISQTITVADTIAPVISVEASNIPIECDGTGNNGAIEAWLANNGGAVASDNCGTITWTNNYGGATSGCAEPIEVTFTATDACGNATSTTASYSILDTVAPVITNPAANETVECDGNGNVAALNAWLANNGGATATDDCSAIAWSNDFTGLSDGCGETGSATVIFTATDGCGNESSTTATFTIIDTIAPVAPAAPADIAYQCVTEVPAAIELTATDNCAGDIVGVLSEVTDSSDACNITITRTWTFTDACDNSSSVSQTITVADTIAPVAPTAPADIAYQCVTEVPVAAELTATDNCAGDIVGVVSEVTDNSDTCNITITRTWTFTDACDNSSSVSQTITVADTIAPVAPAAPADIVYECITEIPAAIELTATDNCSGDIIGIVSEVTDNSDTCNITITRTWTFTDACDNSSSVSQTITVADTIAPMAPAAPADIAYQCVTEVPAAAELTATDNCAGDIIDVLSEVTDSSDACNITITRTWTFTDACDNSSSVSQTITVADTIAPVAPAAPADIAYQCVTEVPVAAELTATDNCAGDIIGVLSEITNDADACNITITRTWTFTDLCENTSSISQTITVADTIAPVISVEASNIPIECDGTGNNGAIEAWLANNGGAVASDNCGTITWTNNYGGATSGCAEPIEVTFTATDACGNATSTTASYSILDTVAPVITNPAANETVECDGNGNVAALNAWLANNGGATATDDCSAIAWSNDFTGLSDGCGETGSATVIFTATDGCGNESSTTATFTIIDTIAPVAPAAPADIAYQCVIEVPAAIELTATDNCAGDIVGVLSEVTDSSDACNITITRTW